MHLGAGKGNDQEQGAGNDQAFTFTLVNVHTDPDEVTDEIKVLDNVFYSVRDDGRNEDDIGYLLGVAGLFYFEQGWLIGTTGFSSATTVPTNAGYSLLFVSMIWLLIVAWPRKQPVQVAPA